MRSSRSAIDVLAMSDYEDQNHDLLVLDVADQAIIAHAVAPETVLLSPQWFSPLPRVVCRFHAFPQELDDGFLSFSIQLLDLLFGGAADLDCPALIC